MIQSTPTSRQANLMKIKTTKSNFTIETFNRFSGLYEKKKSLTQIQKNNFIGTKYNSLRAETNLISLPEIDKFHLRQENLSPKESNEISYRSNPSDVNKKNFYIKANLNSNSRNYELTPFNDNLSNHINTESLSPSYKIFTDGIKEIPEFKIKIKKSHLQPKKFKIKLKPAKMEQIVNSEDQENLETEPTELTDSTTESPTGKPKCIKKSKSPKNFRLSKYFLSVKQEENEIPLTSDFCYKEDLNHKYKKKMEDFHSIYKKDENQILFSLFDGHGGDKVAKYSKDRFPEIFFAFLGQLDNNVERTFQESIKKLENELSFPKAREMGTTISIIYICRSKGQRIVHCANVGDSRCVLISSDKVNRISYDHKCEDRNETERLKQAGGYIQHGRLMGVINLSRSIGDFDMKKYGLISFPNYSRVEIGKNDRFILMASDGVWDVITDLDAFRLSQNIENAETLAEEIVRKAVDYGSRDNISCLAIKL